MAEICIVPVLDDTNSKDDVTKSDINVKVTTKTEGQDNVSNDVKQDGGVEAVNGTADRCSMCGATTGTAGGGNDNSRQVANGPDDKLARSLEASLSTEQIQQLRHLLRQLRDERWHAMQTASDDRDKVLAVKAQLRQTKEDVKALNFTLSKVRKSVKSLQLNNTKDLRILADHFRKVLAAMVTGIKQREEEQRQATGADQWEATIAELKAECEEKAGVIKGQWELNEGLKEENKNLKKENEKQQIIFKSRDQVAKQKITSLENERTTLFSEKDQLQRDLRTVSRSLEKQQMAQRSSEQDAGQLEECKLSLEKVRLNLENAIRERNLYKEKLNTTKDDYEERIKKTDNKHKEKVKQLEQKLTEANILLEKRLEEEKAKHQDTLAKYVDDFRNNGSQQVEKFKQKHDKAQKKIKELEEELERLQERASKKEASLRAELEAMKKDNKPKDNVDIQDVQEFRQEIDRLNSLVAKECEERLELTFALEESKAEFLRLKTLQNGDRGGGIQTARNLTSDVTKSMDFNREGSFYKSRWTSEPSLPTAHQKLEPLEKQPSVVQRDKKVLHTNYAHAVSTEDIFNETVERAPFLPPISKTQKTSDNTTAVNSKKEGIAAFHPNKEGFRLPKPLDYLRSQQQQESKQKQQQQMVSRIFKQNATAAAASAAAAAAMAASTAAHQRGTLMPLVERGNTHLLPSDSHENYTIAGSMEGRGRITVRIPNPYLSEPEQTMVESPYPPNNTPVSQGPNDLLKPANVGNLYSQTPDPDPGGGGQLGPTFDPYRTKPRKTTMDYDFSAAKSTEMVNVTRGRPADSGEARRRVMQLLNQKEDTKRKSPYLH